MPHFDSPGSDASFRSALYAGLFILCIGVTGSQLLLKLTARSYVEGAGVIQPRFLMLLICAGLLSILVQIGWVWALRWIPLGSGYPVFALSFIFVPVASAFLFHESFDLRHVIGGSLIVAGVAVAMNSR